MISSVTSAPLLIRAEIPYTFCWGRRTAPHSTSPDSLRPKPMRDAAASRLAQTASCRGTQCVRSWAAMCGCASGGVAVILLLLALWAAPAGAARITNEPSGFNGYTWGAASTEYPSLRLVTDPLIADPLPGVEVYENPGEALTLNRGTFTQGYYRLFKGGPGGLEFRYEGGGNRAKVRQMIEGRSREGSSPARI